MKKLLLIGSIVLVLGLLIVGFTAPIFAHGPDDGGVASANEEAWEAMHEACESGDWEAMGEGHAEYHSTEDPMNKGMAGSGMMGMMGGMH